MALRREWKIFIILHLGLLAGALLFPLYRLLTGWIPDLFTGCVLHDHLFLYCPLCGGTRAVGALLRLDLPLALAENALVVGALLLFFILDVVALVRLLLKKSVILRFPGWFWVAGTVVLVVWGVLRNVLMIVWGIDPVGDLGVFWHLIMNH